MTQAIITTILFELAPLYIFEAYRDWKIISIANCIIYATLALSLGVYCWNRFVRFKFYGAEYQCLRRETKVILKGYVTQNIIKIYLNIIGGVIMLLFYFIGCLISIGRR